MALRLLLEMPGMVLSLVLAVLGVVLLLLLADGGTNSQARQNSKPIKQKVIGITGVLAVDY